MLRLKHRNLFFRLLRSNCDLYLNIGTREMQTPGAGVCRYFNIFLQERSTQTVGGRILEHVSYYSAVKRNYCCFSDRTLLSASNGVALNNLNLENKKLKPFSSSRLIRQVSFHDISSSENNNEDLVDEIKPFKVDSDPDDLVKIVLSAPKGPVNFFQHDFKIDEDGYVSVEDLVKFLQFEGAMDLCVIKTSGVRSAYVDYFVVVSGVSIRHLRAMAKNLERLFRGYETRGVGKHGHVTVEGLESDDWIAVDIGNMVVHFFLPEMREVYELEKLWTLGPKYDDQYKAMLEDAALLEAMYLGEGVHTEMENHKEDTA